MTGKWQPIVHDNWDKLGQLGPQSFKRTFNFFGGELQLRGGQTHMKQLVPFSTALPYENTDTGIPTVADKSIKGEAGNLLLTTCGPY